MCGKSQNITLLFTRCDAQDTLCNDDRFHERNSRPMVMMTPELLQSNRVGRVLAQMPRTSKNLTQSMNICVAQVERSNHGIPERLHRGCSSNGGNACGNHGFFSEVLLTL